MKSIVRQGQKYTQFSYGKEADFEAASKNALEIVFPDFWVIKFNQYILGEEGSRRRPDLAMIHKNYKKWIVIEVELSTHSLHSHVYPQVHAFSTGLYEISHARQIAQDNPFLDKEKLISMIVHRSPKILVLVDSTDIAREWSVLKEELKVEMAYLETFRDDQDNTLFFYSGYEDDAGIQIVAKAKYIPLIRSFLCKKIMTPHLRKSGRVRMRFKEKALEMEIILTKEGCLLRLVSSGTNIDFTDKRNYDIKLNSEGQFSIVKL